MTQTFRCFRRQFQTCQRIMIGRRGIWDGNSRIDLRNVVARSAAAFPQLKPKNISFLRSFSESRFLTGVSLLAQRDLPKTFGLLTLASVCVDGGVRTINCESGDLWSQRRNQATLLDIWICNATDTLRDNYISKCLASNHFTNATEALHRPSRKKTNEYKKLGHLIAKLFAWSIGCQRKGYKNAL